MLFKETIRRFHLFQFVPRLDTYRVSIQIIDFCPFHREQKRGVRGNNELAAATACRQHEQFAQLQLQFAGKAVFRLVQQIELVRQDVF